MHVNEQGFIAIIIALIGGASGVWAAFLARKNDKTTSTIRDVLERTPMEGLDGIIKSLQSELDRANERHEREVAYFERQVVSLRANLSKTETDNAILREELDRMKRIVSQHEEQLGGHSDTS